ncbi:MAG: hypothetical protein GXP43_00950 [bacterium]|nr:hypothetical protein [bacterium]
MKILLINNQTKYLQKLQSLLSSHSLLTRNFHRLQSLDLNHFDLIILSGSYKYSVLSHLHLYQDEINLIKTAAKPIIGICLGFELIGFVFGAGLSRLSQKTKGIVKIKILNDKTKIFNNLPNLYVYESHRWVISQTPPALVKLAESKYGVEAVKHKTKNIYGFQFHPEMFVDQTAGDEIFKNVIAQF